MLPLKKLLNRKDLIFSKPDKGNGVVVMDRSDYINKLYNIVNDSSKFNLLTNDPTEKREARLQGYLYRLYKSGHLDEASYKKIRPTGSTPSRLYGLPKIHKQGTPLRPIISQIGSYTYELAKFLVPILMPLTTNQYTVKDSFSFVNSLMSLQNVSFMASFDVVSLFTNIPLNETIELCLDKLYTDTDLVHNLPRKTLKTLLNYACKENHFLFDDKFFDQTDGVSMGSPLGPILANIFMCHFESKALDSYSGVKPGVYNRYVDDCFLIFSNKLECNQFFEHLNQQHSSLSFTMESESDHTLPFLDIKITRNQDGSLSTSMYRKPTFSGLYLKWTSFVPKQFKINLVNCLLNRAWRICSSSELFQTEVSFIKDILAANGYPYTFLNSLIHKFNHRKLIGSAKEDKFGPHPKNAFLHLPYKGNQSIVLKRQLHRLFAKLAPWLKLNIVFSASNKLSRLCNLKCSLPLLKQSRVIYKVNCSECDEFYIGKTIRRLNTRLKEHMKDENSSLYRHSFLTDHVIDYCKPEILAKDSNVFRLCVKETLKIQDYYAHKSLNENTGSFKLALW